ncbi:hypothetical protein ACFPOE_11315 [Caenimonas terrae]|uniref:Uncharacterized protein n=1 Tax=Caenimonas terrae TaxID=696074 RepID=A0ABW0NBT4_9BURK
MKLALILATAFSAAPAVPEAPAPQLSLIPQGAVIQCTAPGGCYVANERAIAALVREVTARARASSCGRGADAL